MSADTAELREELAPRAFLHADPDSYLAGVEDALAGMDAGPASEREPDVATDEAS